MSKALFAQPRHITGNGKLCCFRRGAQCASEDAQLHPSGRTELVEQNDGGGIVVLPLLGLPLVPSKSFAWFLAAKKHLLILSRGYLQLLQFLGSRPQPNNQMVGHLPRPRPPR